MKADGPNGINRHGQTGHTPHTVAPTPKLATLRDKVVDFANDFVGDAFKVNTGAQLTMRQTVAILDTPTKVGKHATQAAKRVLQHNDQNFPKSRLQ